MYYNYVNKLDKAYAYITQKLEFTKLFQFVLF